MKKSTKIKLISFSTAFAFTLGGFLLDAKLTSKYQETELEYTYRRALNDLSDQVSGLRMTLKKAPYVSTPVMAGSVWARLLEQSGSAKSAMAVLPLSQEKADRISRFLSQVGDYALSLSRKSAEGKALEDKDADSLHTLEEYAGKLSEALSDVQARLNAERASIGKTRSLLHNVDAVDELPALDDDFDEVSKEFSQFPSLLYDGPFSDHVEQREALFLKDKPGISQNDAAKKAAGFLSCEPEELTFAGEAGATLACYSFTRSGARVNVSKQGGEIVSFWKDANSAMPNLAYEDALDIAAGFLRQQGISSFQESYYVMSDNLCTINFAALCETAGEPPQTVVCYPDLLKVTVELERGEMVEYDAAGYLMNHRERELPLPAVSDEDARKNISPRLTVKSAALALIPTPGLDEVLCYEYRCTAENGTEVLVYLNAVTGMEEQLYLVQKDEHGILTM